MTTTGDNQNRELDELQSMVTEVFYDLLQSQQPLGPEFEAVWDANVSILYHD